MSRADSSRKPADAVLGEELRDALVDVVEGLSLVDGTVLSEAGQRQLGRARAAGRAAARLAGSSSGQGTVDLIELLHDLEDRWGGRAIARGIALSMAIPAGVPRALSVDRVTLERTLSNLLAHAIAGGRDGRVRLSVDLVSDGMRFEVESTSAPQTDRAGADLGLAVTRALAAGMEAELDFVARDGGFRADLTLPPPVWKTEPVAMPEADLSGLRVMLAPLPLSEAETLAEIVARFDGDIEDWRSGAAAAGDATAVFVYDADAEDADAALRCAKEGGAARVVAVTASLLAPHRDGLWEAGVDAVLSRPFPPSQIVARILREAGLRPDPSAPEEPPALDEAQLDHLLTLAGPEVAEELLDRMVEDLSGVETALAAAVPARDIVELRAQTHVLISLAGAVGAVRLQKCAEDLNAAAHAEDQAEIDRLGATAGPDLANLIAHVEHVRATRKEHA